MFKSVEDKIGGAYQSVKVRVWVCRLVWMCRRVWVCRRLCVCWFDGVKRIIVLLRSHQFVDSSSSTC